MSQQTPPFLSMKSIIPPQQPTKRWHRPLPDFHPIDLQIDRLSLGMRHTHLGLQIIRPKKPGGGVSLRSLPTTITAPRWSPPMTPMKDCVSLAKHGLHYVSTDALLHVCETTMTLVYPTSDPSDIVQYYWDETHRSIWKSSLDREPLFCPCIDYWCHHPQLNPRMRAILLDWLAEVCEDYALHRETWYLAVNYIDRYLMGTRCMPTHKFQLLGVTALFMAAKMEEIYPPMTREFSAMTDGTYSCREIMKMELKILRVVRLTLHALSPHFWMCLYLDNAARKTPSVFLDNGNHRLGPSSRFRLDFYQRAMSLLEVCMFDTQSMHVTYSLLSAAVFNYLFHSLGKIYYLICCIFLFLI
jgi:hypothetical protein